MPERIRFALFVSYIFGAGVLTGYVVGKYRPIEIKITDSRFD